MARGVNKAILIGTLGRDPQVGSTGSGSTVVNMSIATNETWTDRASGQKQERTDWHRIVLFSNLADIAAQYLRKGSQVYIEGRIQTRSYQGNDGQTKYITEIIASEMEMLGGRSDGHGSSSPAAPQPPRTSAPAPTDDSFDDIPF